jgi:hypothetical protein
LAEPELKSKDLTSKPRLRLPRGPHTALPKLHYWLDDYDGVDSKDAEYSEESALNGASHRCRRGDLLP